MVSEFYEGSYLVDVIIMVIVELFVDVVVVMEVVVTGILSLWSTI